MWAYVVQSSTNQQWQVHYLRGSPDGVVGYLYCVWGKVVFCDVNQKRAYNLQTARGYTYVSIFE